MIEALKIQKQKPIKKKALSFICSFEVHGKRNSVCFKFLHATMQCRHRKSYLLTNSYCCFERDSDVEARLFFFKATNRLYFTADCIY